MKKQKKQLSFIEIIIVGIVAVFVLGIVADLASRVTAVDDETEKSIDRMDILLEQHRRERAKEELEGN